MRKKRGRTSENLKLLKRWKLEELLSDKHPHLSWSPHSIHIRQKEALPKLMIMYRGGFSSFWLAATYF